jgi:hypothetical protein
MLMVCHLIRIKTLSLRSFEKDLYVRAKFVSSVTRLIWRVINQFLIDEHDRDTFYENMHKSFDAFTFIVQNQDFEIEVDIFIIEFILLFLEFIR